MTGGIRCFFIFPVSFLLVAAYPKRNSNMSTHFLYKFLRTLCTCGVVKKKRSVEDTQMIKHFVQVGMLKNVALYYVKEGHDNVCIS